MDEVAALKGQLRQLTDRLEIADLFTAFTAAMDSQDFEWLACLFTPQIVIEHPGGTWDGFDQVTTGMRKAVASHFISHHMISNQRVAIDGDSARVVAYFHSVHLDDPNHTDQHNDHGGWYLCELTRTSDGWRFSRLKQASVWTAANMPPRRPHTPSMRDDMRTYLRMR
jgi:uncharacterized protein (TIGR02246 family)